MKTNFLVKKAPFLCRDDYIVSFGNRQALTWGLTWALGNDMLRAYYFFPPLVPPLRDPAMTVIGEGKGEVTPAPRKTPAHHLQVRVLPSI